jgi:hypothetical protein
VHSVRGSGEGIGSRDSLLDHLAAEASELLLPAVLQEPEADLIHGNFGPLKTIVLLSYSYGEVRSSSLDIVGGGLYPQPAKPFSLSSNWTTSCVFRVTLSSKLAG